MAARETPFEMTARHVREGEARLARQQALIRRLEQSDLGDILTEARDALARMLQFQETVNEHYRLELAKRQQALLGRRSLPGL